MSKFNMENTTIGQYDLSAVDPSEDPDTPLCVVSVDNVDTVFISPVKDKDYKFVAFVDGEEKHYNDKEAMLTELELYDVDKDTADAFIKACDNFLSNEIAESTIALVSDSISDYIAENKKSCTFENTKYELFPNGVLYINEQKCNVDEEQAKVLYESVEMRTK